MMTRNSKNSWTIISYQWPKRTTKDPLKTSSLNKLSSLNKEKKADYMALYTPPTTRTLNNTNWITLTNGINLCQIIYLYIKAKYVLSVIIEATSMGQGLAPPNLSHTSRIPLFLFIIVCLCITLLNIEPSLLLIILKKSPNNNK